MMYATPSIAATLFECDWNATNRRCGLYASTGVFRQVGQARGKNNSRVIKSPGYQSTFRVNEQESITQKMFNLSKIQLIETHL